LPSTISTESLEQLLLALDASAQGLTDADARQRLAARGFNEIKRSQLRDTVRDLVRATANPLNLILLVAGAASAALGAITDAVIIATMVFLGSGLYFWQTFRSERAMRTLQEKLAPTATVLRDGQWLELPRREVVVGDVIRIGAGDLVPADARLLHATDLHVQQAAMTGESMPAEKFADPGALTVCGADSPGLVFLGTSVVSGTATAIVFAAGANTAFGSIVEALGARPEETDFERGMRRFSILILRTVIFFVLLVLVINIGLGRDAFQSLLFTVALGVGLTPEFLPMITTVTLAQGALRMAREKVIVKHLPAIQNLGSIDVLCTDKTGTLTVGAMSAEDSLDPLGAQSPRALELAALNSALETGIRSPLDAAILDLQRSRDPHFADGCLKTDELPFDFERRRLSVVLIRAAETLLITKGAPESVLGACSRYERGDQILSLGSDVRGACEQVVRRLSAEGLRVLAVAYKGVASAAGYTTADEHDLTLAGWMIHRIHELETRRELLEDARIDLGIDRGHGRIEPDALISVRTAPEVHIRDAGHVRADIRIGGVAEAGVLILLRAAVERCRKTLCCDFEPGQRRDAREHVSEAFAPVHREKPCAIVVYARSPRVHHEFQILDEQVRRDLQVGAASGGRACTDEVARRSVAGTLRVEILSPKQELDRMETGSDIGFVVASVALDQRLPRNRNAWIVEDAGRRIVAHSINVRFVDRPGVEEWLGTLRPVSALAEIDRAFVEPKRFAPSIARARIEPRLPRVRQRFLGTLSRRIYEFAHCLLQMPRTRIGLAVGAVRELRIGLRDFAAIRLLWKWTGMSGRCKQRGCGREQGSRVVVGHG
jgi:hypothetical protein